jgi:hypothetical protein
MEKTPSDIWSYCNFNLKCPNYWNHDECIKAQKINKCPKMKCPECEILNEKIRHLEEKIEELRSEAYSSDPLDY